MSNKPTKYRSNKWFNIKLKKIVFGVSAKINGEWHSVAEGKKLLIYETRKEAIAKVKILNKEIANEQ